MKEIVEKSIYTHKEFDEMIWHDCTIHAISTDSTNFKLLIDLDYILKWEDPKLFKKYFKFWIAPATLVFENVYDSNIIVEGDLELIIDSVTRKNPVYSKNLSDQLEYDWLIELTQGEISLKSIGYKLYIRKKPVLQKRQEFSLEERGGISFDTIPFDKTR